MRNKIFAAVVGVALLAGCVGAASAIDAKISRQYRELNRLNMREAVKRYVQKQ
jgi:outer membrane murein-binding lipoprotein Lpp